MECLHCGKKLGVLRQLKSNEFCSVAHRKAYAKKQNDDALDFLMKSKPALRPPVQSAPVTESSPPQPVEPKQLLVLAQFVPEGVAPAIASGRPMRTGQPVEPRRTDILPAGAHPVKPRLLHAVRVSLAPLPHAEGALAKRAQRGAAGASPDARRPAGYRFAAVPPAGRFA